MLLNSAQNFSHYGQNYARLCCRVGCFIRVYTTLTPQIKGNYRVIHHIIIALTATAFDAEAVTKHLFPLIICIELLKVLHCGFELNMLV